MALRGRILYLVSFDSTEAVVTWQVAELSKAWQAPVVLLGVTPPQWLAFLAKDRQRDLKRRLREVAQRLRGLKGHVGGIKAATGAACTEARRYADQIGAELIITGAGPRALDDPPAVAPAALEIARRARQDVWICQPTADPHLDHVLCAADTTAAAAHAVRRAVDLGRRFNARLRIVSVLPEPGDDDPDEAARVARDVQRRFLDRLDLSGVALSRAIVWGPEAPVELLLEAERFADGVLVIGASSVPGGGGLGATTEPILRACASSVLVVRARGERPDEAAGTAVAKTPTADGERGPEAPTTPPSS